MLRQKANLSDFLIAFSYCSSRSFAEETRALKTRSTVAGHWKLTMTNWEDHQSWPSYKYVRSRRRSQRQPFYGRLAFEAHWKGEKGQWVGVSRADQKGQKKIYISLYTLYSMQQQRTISPSVTYEEKWIVYDNQQWPALWVDWEEDPKPFPKPNLH